MKRKNAVLFIAVTATMLLFGMNALARSNAYKCTLPVIYAAIEYSTYRRQLAV